MDGWQEEFMDKTFKMKALLVKYSLWKLLAFLLLQVWSVSKKQLLLDLPGHADEVFAVDWSPDGEKVASGGRDRLMKMLVGRGGEVEIDTLMRGS